MASYTSPYTSPFYFLSLLIFCTFRLIYSSSNAVCPSGYVCYSGFSTVNYLWQFDTGICPGQSEGQCYNNEKDPRGFRRGPVQKPLIIFLGHRLFFEATKGSTIKPYNVTRNDFYSCQFSNGEAIVSSLSAKFEVPNKYINKVGITYFIAESSNFVHRCDLGVRLEVFVHNASSCFNPSMQSNETCSNKGLCAGKFFTYNMSCVCEPDYLGSYCEEFNSCHSNPCKNGATCMDKKAGFNNEYECKCSLGFTGKDCETNIDDCRPDPCKNESICVDGIGTYRCLCQPGFNGQNCSQVIPNPCVPNPCENGGTCSLDNNRHNYTCKCADAFEGRNCSNNATLKSSVLMSSSMMTSLASYSVMSSTLTGFPTASSNSSSSMTSIIKPSTTSIPASTSSTPLSTSMMSTAQASTSSTPLNTSMMSTAQSPTVTTGLSTYAPTSSLSSNTVAEQSTALLSSPLFSSDTQIVMTSTTGLTATLPPTATPVHSSVSHSSVIPSSFTTTAVLTSTPAITGTTPLPTSASTDTTKLSASFPSSAITATALLNSTGISTVPMDSSSVPSTQSTLLIETSTSIIASPSATHMSSATMTRTVMVESSSVVKTMATTSKMVSSSVVETMATTSTMVSSSVVETMATTSKMMSSPAVGTMTTSTSLPSSVVHTSSPIAPTATTSSATASSSVVPTTIPPTTIPLRQRTCKDNPCNSGTCLDQPDSIGFNFTCMCPKPTYGPRCSTDFKLHFPRFGNGSFLEHKPIGDLKDFNKIVITFKTTALNGLLFYSAQSIDFIQLFVINGYLEFRFNAGDGLVGIRSDVKVNTGKIVTAVLTYDGSKKEGTLQVDKNEPKKQRSNGVLVGIGLRSSELYIGGLKPGKKINTNAGGKDVPTFDGCIKDFEMNNKEIKFTEPDALDWNNLYECDKPCEHQPCQNKGNCTDDLEDPHDYRCTCPDQYTGKKCDVRSVCSGDPCKGGLCIASSNEDSKKCLCPYERAGITCEDDLNITIPCFTMAFNYSSYIQYQSPKDGVQYFSISLQFSLDNTSSAAVNSLLAYSGQENFKTQGDDYIALGIVNNKVVFLYELGSGAARITSDVLDGNLEWHSVVAGRKGKEGFLHVDSQPTKRGSSPGNLVGFNTFGPLNIGGVPNLNDLNDIEFKTGFQGCMSNLRIKFGEQAQFIQLSTTQAGSSEWRVRSGRNVGNKNYNGCNKNPCQNNGTCISKGASVTCNCKSGWHGAFCASKDIPCVTHNPCASPSTCREVNNSAVCDCALGKTGKTCSESLVIQTPRFIENSYMSFGRAKQASKPIYTNTSIKITFNPSNANGLLFYVTHEITSQERDFLSISLHNGFVHYRYDLGKGTANMQSQKAISLNTGHTVIVTRNAKSGTLKVDSEAVISGQSPGNAVGLDVKSDFYVGGVPQLSKVNPSAVVDNKSLKDFVGCVTSVTINEISLVLTEKGAKAGRNIQNCPQDSKNA